MVVPLFGCPVDGVHHVSCTRSRNTCRPSEGRTCWHLFKIHFSASEISWKQPEAWIHGQLPIHHVTNMRRGPRRFERAENEKETYWYLGVWKHNVRPRMASAIPNWYERRLSIDRECSTTAVAAPCQHRIWKKRMQIHRREPWSACKTPFPQTTLFVAAPNHVPTCPLLWSAFLDFDFGSRKPYVKVSGSIPQGGGTVPNVNCLFAWRHAWGKKGEVSACERDTVVNQP